MSLPTIEDVEAEVGAWVDSAWDPDLTIGEWWQKLADEGLSHPMLPEHAYGRGWSRSLANAATRAMASRGALGAPTGLGRMLAAPTIAAHGTQEQIDRYVKPILNGQHAWCQLFSEPGAGSDLAGLQTRAELDGEEWVVNGQKVWTSGGHVADMGMLIARTDNELPKHQGISYFAFDMHQDGVDVRPLKEMTGRALFNEVFITDARVNDDARIGGKGDGWRVANTTLMEERASLGTGTVPIAQAQPGSVAGQLERRAGDITMRRGGGDGVPPVGPALLERLIELAVKLGRIEEPVVRQELMRLRELTEVNRLSGLRAKAGGSRTGAEGNIAKLMMSEQFRRFREVGNLILGADGMLDGRESGADGWVQEVTLFSPGPAIYGGTDQVQRNIIGERVLGLAKEPGHPKETPFKDLPKNG